MRFLALWSRVLVPTGAAFAMLSPSGGLLAQQASPDTVLATVRYVHPSTRTLRTVTGISLALRVDHFSVPESCAISIAGRAAELQQIRQGQIVRIQYRATGERMVADVIEVVSDDQSRGQP